MNYKRRRNIIYSICIYTTTVLLCIVTILIFNFVAHKDQFSLYDEYIELKLDSSYKIDVNGSYNIDDYNMYIENPSIASIDLNGNITTHSLGETKVIIKSKHNLFSNQILLNVKDFSIYSITLEEDSKNIKTGDIFNLSPILNNDINVKSRLEYSSSDKNIAVVNSNGEVFGLNTGSAIITVKEPITGLSTSMNVNVNNDEKKVEQVDVTTDEEPSFEEETEFLEKEIESIKLNTYHLNLYIGDLRKISASVTPSDVGLDNIVWSTSDSKVASIDKNGMLRANGSGICNIYASSKDSKITTSLLVRVNGKRVNVTNIDLETKKIKLDINENYLINPILTPSNATDKVVTYSSSDPSVATVSSAGNIHAIKSGSVKIVAITKDGGYATSLDVEVSNEKKDIKKIKSSIIKSEKRSLIVGEKTKIDVSLIDLDGNNVEYNLVSSDNSIAEVSSDGVINPKLHGMFYVQIISKDGSYTDRILYTVLPSEILPELIYLNKTIEQTPIDKNIKLNATVLPEEAVNKQIVWYSSDKNMASVTQNGIVIPHKAGTVTITAQIKGTSIKRSMTLVIVPKQNLIDVRNKKLTGYYVNFKVYDSGTTNMRAMQNFALNNKGIKNEYLFISMPSKSLLKKDKKLTNELKKDLTRTIIVAIPKTEVYNPSSKKITYMHINNGGHGQTFDIDGNNYIWTNSNGFIKADSNGSYWGNHNSLEKVKFKKNKENDKYKSYETVTLKNDNGNIYTNPEISFDWENNLVAVRSSTRVLIYKANDFVNGKLVLLYTFVMQAKSMDGTNYSRQGNAIKDGYYYQYRGFGGTKMYIEVYNYIGQLQYVYTFDPKLKDQEAEGLKIYDNTLYVGITNSCNGCNGKVNSIYYFK